MLRLKRKKYILKYTPQPLRILTEKAKLSVRIFALGETTGRT